MTPERRAAETQNKATTLMDHAAKALLESASSTGGAYYMDIPSVEALIRAVLMSLREPDRKWAADACAELCEPELTYNPAPASAFTAIIDAILADGMTQ